MFDVGSIEQAIAMHPLVAECCVVGIPDPLKGHLPFAFVTLSVSDHPSSPTPDKKLSGEIKSLVRDQVGSIASLGGIIMGKGIIPKTRSGKTLRRVLRELVENASRGNYTQEVSVPSTIEDGAIVEAAREMIKIYFSDGHSHAGSDSEGIKPKL